jgi:hypothetical protein
MRIEVPVPLLREAIVVPVAVRTPMPKRTGVESRFLKRWSASAAISVQQISHDDDENDEADRTDSPSRAHSPVQAAATTEEQQQQNQNQQQIHFILPQDVDASFDRKRSTASAVPDDGGSLVESGFVRQWVQRVWRGTGPD